MRFLRCVAGLAVVAGLAGRDDVRPLVGAAAVAREDVVERQVSRLLAAVLARVAVAQEDVSAGEAALGTWSTDEVDEADNRGDFEERGGAVEVAAAVFDDLGFTAIDQYESAPDVADVQRLVVLI